MHISPGSYKRFGAASGLAMAVLLLVACASTPDAPEASLTAARDAIAHAEQSDARQYAGAELDEAKEKLAQAERAVEAEDMQDAEQYAQQSRGAAELAKAKTAEAKSAEINRQMGRDAEALDEEMKRMEEQQ